MNLEHELMISLEKAIDKLKKHEQIRNNFNKYIYIDELYKVKKQETI